ncbi:MAG: tetratricopeptide repeat protein [Patiriisocius sp.]|uniref:tetratricopeptide repeat protein n=1 Tax=Patiriisocius sp. TaxID=2822396 RepID=UPI003EF50AF0
MGGSGHGQTVLNNNRKLLGKRYSLFSKETNARMRETKRGNYQEGIVDDKKFTAFERQQIQLTIKNQSKIKNRILFVALILIVSVVSFGFFKLVTAPEIVKTSDDIIKYEKEYLRYIERGDTWIEYKKWEPAIQLYQKALIYYPNAFEPNYRLALAYSYSCKFQNFHCEDGSHLIEELSNEFPDNAGQFLVLDSIFKKYKKEPIFLSN